MPLSPLETEIEQPPLPPADRGRDAWLMLFSSCVIQLPVWGFSLVAGIFQEYFLAHGNLHGNSSELAIVGTTSTGVLYLLSPFTFTLLSRYPHLLRYCTPVGLLLTLLGTPLSSFSVSVWQLIATQGVLSAVGNALLFSPITLYLNQWFIEKRGLATGIMWAAKSISGVALPFIASSCLERFGYKVTLQAWAVTTLVTTLIALRFMKPRIPPATSTSPRRLDFSFLKLHIFWMLQLGNILQSFGYFLPPNYLPTYSTTTMGLSPTIGTLLLSIYNATSIVGGIVLGMLCDRFAVTNIMFLSSVGSAASVLLFWGLASPSSSSAVTIALLTLFSLTYGFFAGGFSSTWSGILTQVQRDSPAVETGLIFGLLAGGRGIGNVVSGPLSTTLLRSGALGKLEGGTGFETQYGTLIVFTGVTALLGAWGWMWRHVSALC